MNKSQIHYSKMPRNLSKIFVLLLCLMAFSCATKKPLESVPATGSITPVEPVDNSAAPVSPVGNIRTVEIKEVSLADSYNSAFSELQTMLEYGTPDFKRAVFVTENAYYRQGLSYTAFLSSIDDLITVCNAWVAANRLAEYDAPDSLNVLKNYAIYIVMKNTVYLSDKSPFSFPYTYDFEDFLGTKDWSKMFVSKLLQRNSGNCHSLPYMYKILADELKATAWLSLAPNHIYVKNRCKKIGWYNTELTSGQFPTDAWVKASGYISLDAIRSGIYMDTLSPEQSISLCVYDLAKGYERQTGNYSDGFILRCCDLALKFYPNHINSIILKAETLKKRFDALMKKHNVKYPSELFYDKEAKALFDEMEGWYVKAVTLGYYEMPSEMYLDWLVSLKEEKEKYTDTKTNRIFK